MISFWPHWQRPFLLLILPIIIWLLWKLWHFYEIKGSWQKLIPTLFQPWLLTGTYAKGSTTPKIILTLASLLAFLALLGPSWQHVEQPPLKIDSPLVIVLDLTPNMLANDIPPSRLQSAKRKVIDIIKARKDAQTAVVVYSNSAHILVPLSDDQATIANLLDYISPNIMPSIGQRADLAIAKAISLLTNTQQGINGQILLVTTGLSDTEQSAIKQLLANHTITLNILGVGTSQGAPIASSAGGFLKDSKGQILLPKLNATVLQNFAYAQGGYYSTITLNDSDIQNLNLANVKGSERHLADAEKRITDYWQDQGYWLLLPLLLLAALAGRKGWLCCIPLLLLLPSPSADAFEWNQIWLNKDQQGQHLLKENKPAEAAKRFQNEQWQAYSSYEAKDYQQAAKRFATETSAEGIYNYGNSLARQGKYKEAITEWDKAIKAKPNFTQAIKNKQLVEELLKKQQQQQQNKQQSSNNSQQNSQANNNAGQNQQQQQNQQQDANKQQQQSPEQQQNSSSQPKQGEQQPQNTNNQQGQSAESANKDGNESKPKDQQNDQGQQNTQDQQQAQNNSAHHDSASDQNKPGQNQNTATDSLEQEQKESLQQWMRTIPDDPSELLRRKFYYEQRYKGDN